METLPTDKKTIARNEKMQLRNALKKKEVVKIEHLKKSFNGNPVLKDVNFTVNGEENVVVVGKSGAGKSVLIKCMVGLIEPDSGKIMVLNKDVRHIAEEEMDKLRLRIGFLFQSAALYDSMTIKENLLFPMQNQLKDLKEKEIKDLVKESLDNVGLGKAINKMPSELSGGMKKRVGLARALMLRPEIMLYDEPTTGLDPVTSREISELILDMQKKFNISSVIITHDMECARITANRMVMLKEGVFAAEGTYEDLEKNEDPWINSFFMGMHQSKKNND
jgi:phospholipid/cholesterol/gamma-HCH transport system ATP-binding protein